MKLAAAILLVTAVCIGANSLPAVLNRAPIPSVHDEFSYLLAADTFAHGRLTNPPLPHPEYFETFQELMRPTYASKYPPAQGLVLALGQTLGHPFLGALGMMALGCGAIVWMAAGVLRLRWALWVGLIAALHPMIHLWATDYWGGNVATFAGALLLGVSLRTARKQRWWHGVVAACSYGLLFNSRPLEGSLFALLVLTGLLCRTRHFARLRPAVIAFLLTSLPIFAWDAYYNWRVTVSAITFPYTLYAQQYQRAPLTFFQQPKPFNRALEAHLSSYWNDYDFKEYQRQATWSGFMRETLIGRTVSMLGYWVDPWVLWLPFVAGLVMIRFRRVRWVAGMPVALPLILLFISPWQRMHYLAPAAGAFFLLLGFGIASISHLRFGRWIAILILIWNGWQFARITSAEIKNDHPLGWNRQHLVDQLSQLPGPQLIIVRYSGLKQLMFEWVFNSADLRASRVVFARERGGGTLSDLRQLFPDRRIWLLTVRDSQYEIHEISTVATELPSDNPGE